MSNELAQNLKRYRRAAGLSQEGLAEATELSVKTVQKVEQGGDVRTETLHTLARALKVDTSALFAADSPAPVVGDQATRRNLVAFRSVLMPPLGLNGPVVAPAPSSGRTSIRQQIGRAVSLYRADELDSVARVLPDLLLRAREAANAEQEEEDQRRAQAAYVEALYVAGKYLTQVRQYDLAYTALAEGIRIAQASNREHLAAVGIVGMGWLLLRQDRFRECYDLAVATASQVEPKMSDSNRARRGLWGELWMRAAASAIRDNRPDEAKEARLMVARAVGGMDTEDEEWPATWGGFGPVTAEVKAIEDCLLTERTTSDAREVLARAEKDLFKPESLKKVGRPSGSNWSRHRLDVASAHTLLGSHQDAMNVLTGVRSTHEEWLRHQPMARYIMEDILHSRKRKLTTEMREMAAHLGVQG
ncbi:helix-turn-helix domain-containing protein [Streptomyces luteireticuli]|uniref:Helix-turn-helix domain-containing protein n=1 Tax=Streptomyces luteireticuli TaxID=173858 RepID=A0ABP3IIR9_9ACTN